ncbi:MAG: tetratricopeptide repeat protein [Anaerolineae bacterium]|nr:tetratricopeptide repeat protein [Anaerolineae bacterium]
MWRRRAGLLALVLAAGLLAGFVLVRIAPDTPPEQTPPAQATRTLDEMDAAIEREPDDPGLYVERGKLILLIYEWDRALANFNQALELDPGFAEAYYQRGLLYASAPDGTDETRSLAIADFRRFLDLVPGDTRAQRAADYIQRLAAALEG